MEHFAENVVELLDTQGIQRARFFGHSMGGYVALCLALDRPERVERIATLGTKFRWDPHTAARGAGWLDPAKIRVKVPQFAATLAERHERAGGWVGVLERTADLLRDLGDNPRLTDATLARIAPPVRVLVGDRDDTVSVDESTGAARVLANGSVTVLPNTPHPIEQVDVSLLAPVLLDFLGG